jgi:hypothetical protein
MSNTVPPCRTITVCAFRGDRSRIFAKTFQRAIDHERHARGPGPALLDCLIRVAHTGVSTDRGTTIYGFHPDDMGVPVWQLVDGLKNGTAMSRLPSGVWQDEERLGNLAMKFRGTRNSAERQTIAGDYSQTVERLIQSGSWQEMPALEDQLPDAWMPKSFFEFWLDRRSDS